jgi:glycosyltransferase involved in cell wall biosynthesis
MRDRLVSVIVCTYNRSAILAATLGGLAVLETDRRFEYEVIVVDNNSTDRTGEIVASFAPCFSGGLLYAFEKRRGKSFALNTGIKKAAGDIIAFTDDDVMVDRQWLLNLRRCFERYGCDGAGGRILPLYPARTPAWVKRHCHLLSGPIGLHDFGSEVKPNIGVAPFAGANMAFRAGCLSGSDWFRCDLGAGDLPPGEDTELFKRLQAMGKKLYYCGDAVVHHRISAGKTNFRHVTAWAIGYGRSMTRRKGQKDGVCYFGYPRWIFKRFLWGLATACSRIRDSGVFLDHWINTFAALGEMIEYKRMKKADRQTSLGAATVMAAMLMQKELTRSMSAGGSTTLSSPLSPQRFSRTLSPDAVPPGSRIEDR